MPPIDYSLPNPMQSIAQGLQIGQALNQISSERQQREAAAIARRQMQEDLGAVVSKANPTAKDYASLTVKYPQFNEQFKQAWEMLSSEQQSSRMRQVSDVYAALDAGKPDAAKQMLEVQAEAAENSGDVASARAARTLAESIDMNPATAKTSVGLRLASMMGPDKFTETFTKLQEERRAAQEQPGVLEKQAADIGLTKAQTGKVLAETEKLGAEMKKAVMELEAGGKTIDPEKRFDQEKKLRDEYVKRTANFQESNTTYENLKSSAASGAAGDIALVTSFMKMLDPGSVVRETEFATARDTAGLLARLQNLATKVQSGEFLSDDQRKSFVALAGKYMSAAENNEKRVRGDLERVVKNYGLTSENIFGEKAKSTQPAAAATPAVSQRNIVVDW